jgi:sugar fermentation stimulation protein A
MGQRERIEAKFIIRKNRFVGEVDLDGRRIPVYIPNTGRMLELLIPGRKVILTPSNGRYAYKLEYVIYRDNPVLIDSIQSNRIFHDLIERKKIPHLEKYSITGRELRYGDKRFDFLLAENNSDYRFAEIKSCTLAWRNIASFPDAVTERGTHHIRALAESGRGMIIFLIFHRNVDYLVPNYHTDYRFYQTLVQCKNRARVLAYSVNYNSELDIIGVKDVTIVYPDVKPVGSYLLLFENDSRFIDDIGSIKKLTLERGYYIYAGSGMNNLFKRIAYHKKKAKKKFWHIDYVKNRFKLLADIPVVTGRDMECTLAHRMLLIGGNGIEGFGASDCTCRSHLFHFDENPLYRDDFWDIVLEARFDQLLL